VPLSLCYVSARSFEYSLIDTFGFKIGSNEFCRAGACKIHCRRDNGDVRKYRIRLGDVSKAGRIRFDVSDSIFPRSATMVKSKSDFARR
jgi:hypothetical protein